MVANEQERQNGKTAGDEIVADAAREFDRPVNPELPEERERRFQSPGFARMKLSMSREDREVMDRVHAVVNRQIDERFADAFAIMHELYDRVRDRETDEVTGADLFDDFDLPIWRRSPSGMYVEDWSRLSAKEREHYLYLITTRLFEWTQQQAESWAEAMFAKAKWEMSFAAGYESLEGGKPTIGDRENRGRLESQEDRYYAIYVTYLSRKADGVVRSMELLSQRLKDVHVSNGAR